MTMKWFLPKELQERSNPLAHRARRPNPIDISEQWVVNEALAVGLYQGTYPGLKLASALAYVMVSVPVAFMGMPIPKSNDEQTTALLREIQEGMSRQQQKTYLIRRIVGTAWRWPSWDSKRGVLCHELIPDSSVTDIIRNIDTGEVLQIIVTEQLTYQQGENIQGVVERKRYFTPQTVRTVYSGDVPAGLITNKVARNPAGIMPIPFANDVLDNSIRGKSVYSRVISDLKNYHDVDLKWSQTLAKFNVKMVQYVSESVASWIEQNPQLGTLDALDVEEADVIFNIKDKEDSDFVFPQGFSEAFEKKLSQTFYKIVEGSGVPEMFYGLVSTGNHASAEQQMTAMVNTVQDDRNQIEDPEKQYYAACLRLLSTVRMTPAVQDFDLEWNDLETVSQSQKAEILSKFGDAVSKLQSNAAITLQTLHKLYQASFPRATVADFGEFMTQMNLAGKFKQFQNASYSDALDAQGVGLDVAIDDESQT